MLKSSINYSELSSVRSVKLSQKVLPPADELEEEEEMKEGERRRLGLEERKRPDNSLIGYFDRKFGEDRGSDPKSIREDSVE